MPLAVCARWHILILIGAQAIDKESNDETWTVRTAFNRTGRISGFRADFDCFLTAQAKITFHIEIGPGYGVRPLPGRFSCRAIGERLWQRGYNNIRVLDCRGSVYKFSARKDGWRWHLNVSSKTARILDRYRIAR